MSALLAKADASATTGGSLRITEIVFYRWFKVTFPFTGASSAIGSSGGLLACRLNGMSGGGMRGEEELSHFRRLINHSQNHIAIRTTSDA